MTWFVEDLERVYDVDQGQIEDDQEHCYITVDAYEVIRQVKSGKSVLDAVADEARAIHSCCAEQTAAIECEIYNELNGGDDLYDILRDALLGNDIQFRFLLDNDDYVHVDALPCFAFRLEGLEDDVTDEEWGKFERYVGDLRYLTSTSRSDSFGRCEVTGQFSDLRKYTFEREA